MARVCRRAGMSRQNYYETRRKREREGIEEEAVLALVKRERREQPRLGVRKLTAMLGGELGELGIELGRDRWFGVMRRAGLLVKAKGRKKRTTQSRHSLAVYRNLVKGKRIGESHEVWVSDLTYLRTREGFVYAAVVMDAWSRKIVGWHVGDSLESEGCQVALGKALEQLPEGRKPIHHSDRGSQYCCHEYVEKLRERGLGISMTEELHCYENAAAERVIGILKGEYELDGEFGSKEGVKKAFEEAVRQYNHRRPHERLEYRVPAEVHESRPGEVRGYVTFPALRAWNSTAPRTSPPTSERRSPSRRSSKK